MADSGHLTRDYITIGPRGTSPDADLITVGADDGAVFNLASAILKSDAGGHLVIRKGTYNFASTNLWRHAVGNSRITFEPGAQIIGDATTTADTPLLTIQSTDAAGSAKTITANVALGADVVTMASGDGSTFSAGDYVLLKSDRVTDTESSAPNYKQAGEIKRVKSSTSTTVTFQDPTMDAYLTSDTAKLVKIPFLEHVTFEGLSIASLAATSALTQGSILAKFVDDLKMRDGIFEDIWAAIQIMSCINSKIYDNNIREVLAPGGGTVQYGVWVAGASHQVSVSRNEFRGTRHAVTTGGVSGTNNNGIQRAISVDGNKSYECNTAHFDTHQPCDGVTFTKNFASGGKPPSGQTGAVHGYQARGQNVEFEGNEARAVPGRGLMVFKSVTTHTRIRGNRFIDQRRSVSGSDGTGIYLDSDGASRGEIKHNMIVNAEGRAIYGSDGNDYWDVSSNYIDGVNTAFSTQSAVKFNNSDRGRWRDNVVINCPAAPFEMTGTSTGWDTGDNTYDNNGAGEILVGTNTTPGSNRTGLWVPKDNGLIAASLDPAVISGSGTQPAAGVLQVARLWVPGGKPISNILLNLTAAGSGLTSGQCKAALFLADGTWVRSTGDLSTDWATIAGSTNAKTHALTSSYTPAEDGYVFIGWWGNGTTMPTFLRGVQATGAANIGISAAPYRFATADTGLTTTAPSTLGAQTAINTAYVVAVS